MASDWRDRITASTLCPAEAVTLDRRSGSLESRASWKGDGEVGDDVGHHGEGRDAPRHLAGIDLVERVAGRMVEPEIAGCVNLQPHCGHPAVGQRLDVSLGSLLHRHDRGRTDSLEQ